MPAANSAFKLSNRSTCLLGCQVHKKHQNQEDRVDQVDQNGLGLLDFPFVLDFRDHLLHPIKTGKGHGPVRQVDDRSGHDEKQRASAM